MLSKILIVDDSELDRRSIKKVFLKTAPNAKICEAPNIGTMYHLLGPDVDLLIQDISFVENEEQDSSGLNALYDVMEFYSGLPIVIITGHFFDKVKEFQATNLWRKSKFLGYYDKLTLSNGDAERIVKDAIEAKKARSVSEEIQQRLDYLENRGRELESQLEFSKNKEKSLFEQTSNYKRAFTGHDLLMCIEAEAKITGGNANYSAFRVCKEIELEVKRRVKNSAAEYETFFQKIQHIRTVYGMSQELFNSIQSAWSKRNALVHEQGNITKESAKNLLHVLQTFRDSH